MAAAVREHHGPSRPWSHHAVLVRTNAQAVEFEKAFRAAQVPFRVRGGGGLLRQPEITAALADLSASPARVAFAEPDHRARGDGPRPRWAIPTAGANLDALVRLAREYELLDTRPLGARLRGLAGRHRPERRAGGGR